MTPPTLSPEDLELIYQAAFHPSEEASAKAPLFQLVRMAYHIGRPAHEMAPFYRMTPREKLIELARYVSSHPAVTPLVALLARGERELAGQTAEATTTPPATTATTVLSAPGASTATALNTPAAEAPAVEAPKKRKGVKAATEGEGSPPVAQSSPELDGRVYTTVLRLLEDFDVFKKEIQARLNRLEAATLPPLEALQRQDAARGESVTESRELALLLLEHLIGMPRAVAITEARMRGGLPPA